MRILGVCLVVVGLCASAVSLPSCAESMTVSQYGRLATTLPWAVALKKGMFKEAGLKIDSIDASPGGGTGLRNMLAGSLPFAVITAPTAIAGAKAGVDIKIVNCQSNHIGDLAWVARAGSGVNTLKDLNGKKVGFSNPKSFTEMVLRVVLTKEGLIGKVEPISTGGLGAGLTALSQGAIGAAPEIEPGLTQKAANYKVLFYARDVLPEFAMSLAVTTSEFAAKNPETIRKLVGIHRKAVQFIYANSAEAQRIYAEVWEIKLDEARAQFPQFIAWRIWSDGSFTKGGLEALSNSLMAIGDIPKPVDWKTLIDQSFMEPAQRIQL